jgi:hypothetical protein
MQANPLIRKNSLWDEVKIQRIKKIDKNLLWVGSNIQKRELPVNGVLAQESRLAAFGFPKSGRCSQLVDLRKNPLTPFDHMGIFNHAVRIIPPRVFNPKASYLMVREILRRLTRKKGGGVWHFGRGGEFSAGKRHPLHAIGTFAGGSFTSNQEG